MDTPVRILIDKEILLEVHLSLLLIQYGIPVPIDEREPGEILREAYDMARKEAGRAADKLSRAMQ